MLDVLSRAGRLNGPDPEKQYLRFQADMRNSQALKKVPEELSGTDVDRFAEVRAVEEWGIPGYVGALIRLNDKVRRLQAYVRKGYDVNGSPKDDLMDIAVYGLIGYVLVEEQERRPASSAGLAQPVSSMGSKARAVGAATPPA